MNRCLGWETTTTRSQQLPNVPPRHEPVTRMQRAGLCQVGAPGIGSDKADCHTLLVV